MLMNLWKRMRDQKGFTLIELIFVVIILAVLTGVALINLGGTEDDAKLAAVKADFHTLATAIKVYKVKTGAFPTAITDLLADSGTYKAMLDADVTEPDGIVYTLTPNADKTTVILSANTSPPYSVTIK